MGGKNSTEKNTVDIAVIGVDGGGKSSLVNALRGLSDEDDGAAETGVVQTTTEPLGYPHPAFPDVIIWDLPGIGTPLFKPKEYLEMISCNQYDFFIIVASSRFTVFDMQLSQAIQKMKKPFYYVRSKVDIGIKDQKLNPQFNEEATLQHIRKYCLDNLVAAGISSPQIFLISRWFLDQYDFPLLQRTLENDTVELRKRILRPAILQDSEKGIHNRATESSRRTMGGKCLAPVVSNEPEEKFAREKGNISDMSVSQKTTLDIAITGKSGAGKSSLVNALRGLSDFDEEAAKTDVTEKTTESMGYPHPNFPDVTIWDLPGIGTPNFKAEEYLEKVNYSQYDFFIIVASNRFTVYDIQLSHAVQKMKKQFYYVWSKMDSAIKNEKLNPAFNEEATLQHVRKHCLDNLMAAGISSPHIFLISTWYTDKYDFLLLQTTLKNEIEALRRHILRPAVLPISNQKRDDNSTKPSKKSRLYDIFLQSMFKIDLTKMRDRLKQRNLKEVAEEIRRELDELQNAKLDIAITGVSGAGKSSLANALRGMTDYEEGAAKIGVTQTTMECHAYPHPLFPKVTIWDLPGIGTPEFRPQEYLEKVNFTQYDFFMIVSSERFTQNDVLLAHEIQKMKKKFYFVRSKMDESIMAEIRDPKFDIEKSLQKIREDCCRNLTEVGESNPRVFLISRRDLYMYDFPDLQEALENDLDDLKRQALILAMPIFSRQILKKKKAAMEACIWGFAIVSCVIGVVPVPGLSFACDLSILVGALLLFYKVFGLDEESLHRAADVFHKDYEVLKTAIKKSPMSSEITPAFIGGLLARSVILASVSIIELVLDFIPVLGSVFGGVSSFVTTFFMLRSFLKDIVEDAENVRAKATEP